MRWALWITVTLSILLGAYITSPLIALQRIASAVETRDAVALTERIEFPSLRRSLTKQIVAAYLKLIGKKLPIGVFGVFGKRLAVSVADPVVARLMTVRALLDLLGKGEAGNGREIYWVAGDTLMAAKVSMDDGFTVTTIQELFKDPSLLSGTRQYDVGADGRFVMTERLEPEGEVTEDRKRSIHIVQNWYEEFRNREQD